MTSDIPQHFDEAFLRWFRERTEETWQRYQTRTFEEFVASRVGGSDWQQGTRWLGGLSEQEITTIEQHYHMRFPPDYRLFLHVLHSVDRPKVGARYVDGKTMIPTTAPSFYNWQKDTEAIELTSKWLVDGLLSNVQDEEVSLWQQSWGEKPATPEAQEARVRELVNGAPKLIPVYMHHYLLAEPCEAGNPVLSIYGTDMITHSSNLHRYFLTAFGNLIGGGRSSGSHLTQEKFEASRAPHAFHTIPFWGEFLS